MDYKIKRSGSYKVEVTFHFDANEVEEAYQAAYKKARKAIKLDGFRKGKAPLDMIEKLVGEDARPDAVEYLLHEKIFPEFGNLEPKPISLPEISIEKVKRNKSGSIKATYEAFPVYKVPKFKKLKVTQPKLRVPDRLIEKELKRLQTEEALTYTREEGDAVQEGDLIQVHLRVLHGEKELLNYESFKIPVSLSSNQDKEDKEDEEEDDDDSDKNFLLQVSKVAVGLKIGDTGEIDFTFDEDEPMDVLRGKATKIFFTIKEASYTELPEINDAFARDVGDYKNLAELRQKIRKDLLAKGEEKRKAIMEDQLVDALVENLDVELPPSMLEAAFGSHLDIVAEKMGISFPNKKSPAKGKRKKSAVESVPLTPDEKFAYFVDVLELDPKLLEKDFRKAAERVLRQQLAFRAIYTKEKFDATEEELTENIRRYYTEKYGELNEGAWEFILQDQGAREDALGRIKVKKTLELLRKHAVIKKGPEVDVDKIEPPSDT